MFEEAGSKILISELNPSRGEVKSLC